MKKNNFKRVVLYGLAGADKMYMPLSYTWITDDPSKGLNAISIANIIAEAAILKAKNPSIERVYAIDSYYGLLFDYRRVIKNVSVEECAIFKNLLETSGLLVL